MFYRHIGKNNYLYSDADKLLNIDDFKNAKDIAFPLNIDTEFSTENNQRLPLTVQCKGIEKNSKGTIFCHQEFKEYANKNNLKLRHTVLKEDFAGIDYLKALAIPLDFKFIRVPSVDTIAPKIYFDIYSHHALSELLIMFTGELKEEIKGVY
ncbi:MAG: hypothetical protein HC930_08220 [Hydrococcus sp. SU_1_0]|nr:hypothetical protein [Hydrococcus sp. SU_1_0]